MGHRVGRKLEMNDVEGRRLLRPARMGQHPGTHGCPADAEPGAHADRFAGEREIRRRAAVGDDVGVVHLGREAAGELEHVTLETAEVRIGITPECEDANQLEQ